MNGKIIVFTGEGKGKTSAALGMALRAAGHGFAVIFIQFLKKGDFGELKIEIQNVTMAQFGREGFISNPEHRDYETAQKGLQYAIDSLNNKPFMIVLDEINQVLSLDLIPVDELLSFLNKRGATHIILTGRNAKSEIINHADIVTNMQNIRHYYDHGIKALIGLEY